ncbi:B12-binding domain-containing radical SAM protein [Actinomadura craniellae]|nr:radical SAM protein [Actinomadura craniellae]
MKAHPGFRPLRKTLWELPHWILWLAGVLENAGYSSLQALELYTLCPVLNGVDEDLAARAIRDAPGDVYLLSPMAVNLPQALRIAQLIKSEHPRAVVVFGGVAATPLDEEVASSPHVDYVLRGRAEIALPLLMDAIASGGETSRIRGVTGTWQGRVRRVEGTYADVPPGRIPFPRVDLFDSSSGQDIRYIRQNYALGCPFTCEFCTIQTIGRSPGYFPPQRVLDEIAAYRTHYGDHHHVYFGDETFTLNLDRTREICSVLAAEGGIEFDAQTRLNCLRNPELPAMLHAGGCRWIEIGLESLNTRSQDLFKQHTDTASLERTLDRLVTAGIGTCTFLIMGLPNESVDDMRRTVDRACSLLARGLLTASYVSVFVPYPGTAMFDRPADYGMRLHHRSYDLFHEDLPPVYDSASARSDEVYEVFLEAVSLFTTEMRNGH